MRKTALAALTLLAACASDVDLTPPVSTPIIATIEIEAASNLFIPGEFVQLEARAFDVFGREVPNIKFSWTSSNTNIATVDDGLVHALNPGNVSITVVAERVVGRYPVTVRVIPPNIRELEPSSTTAGQPLTLTIWGSGFYRGSVVRLNGQSKPTTYISGRLIRAELSASDVALPGSYIITVYNAVAGAGFSNPVPFEVR